MPRKTSEARAESRCRRAASMRPRPDAAENDDADAGVGVVEKLLQ